MRQQPRLGIERTLLFGFVIARRIVADGEQRRQREHRLLVQPAQMPGFELADAGGVAIDDLKGRVNLGHTLLEPQRPEPIIVP